MKISGAFIAITALWYHVGADQQQSLRRGDLPQSDNTHVEQHSVQPPARTLSQADDDEQCTEVYRRPLFGVAGDTTKFVSKTKGWIELTKQYGPFGYGSPDPQPNTLRKWRLYAVYWDENSSGSTNVQIKIANGDDVVFTMPRIAGGWGWKAAHFSDYYQKGSGSAEEINKAHSVISARLDSTAPYNNNGAIHAVDLIAYDCEIKEPEMCTVTLQHKAGGRSSDGSWSLNNMLAFQSGGGSVPITVNTGSQPGGATLKFLVPDTVATLAFATQDAKAFDLTVTGCSNGLKGPGYMDAVHWSNSKYRDGGAWTAAHNLNEKYWSYNVVHISEAPTAEFLPWSDLPF